MAGCLLDWLTDWLHGLLSFGLTDWLTDWPANRSTVYLSLGWRIWLANCPTDGPASKINWMSDCLSHWPTDYIAVSRFLRSISEILTVFTGWEVCISLHITSSLVISRPCWANSARGSNTSPMTFCREYSSCPITQNWSVWSCSVS